MSQLKKQTHLITFILILLTCMILNGSFKVSNNDPMLVKPAAVLTSPCQQQASSFASLTKLCQDSGSTFYAILLNDASQIAFFVILAGVVFTVPLFSYFLIRFIYKPPRHLFFCS